MFKLIPILFCLSFAHAEVGEVLSLMGSQDATLTRNGSRSNIVEGTTLEVGDLINSGGAHVTLLLYPKIQMGLTKGSEMRITKHMIEEASNEKTVSLIDLVKGLIRIQVNHDENEKVEQSVHSNNVTFAVRGTEYEVSTTDEDAELDVFEGEVQVSSPLVQTFVPEIVKRGEGFRFNRKNRQFARRALKERNKEARFLRKEELRSRAVKRRAERQAKKAERIEERNERRQEREARRAERRERKGRGR